MMEKAVCQVCQSCVHCLMVLTRSVSSGREFFDILENVIYLEADIVCRWSMIVINDDDNNQ